EDGRFRITGILINAVEAGVKAQALNQEIQRHYPDHLITRQGHVAIDVHIGGHVGHTAGGASATTVLQSNNTVRTYGRIADIHTIVSQLLELNLNILAASKASDVFFIVGKAYVTQIIEIPLATNVEVGRFEGPQEGVARTDVVDTGTV